MLITQLKESIDALVTGKAFIINCFGCKEVHFPEKEAVELQKGLKEAGKVTEILTMDYICNPKNLELHLNNYKAEIDAADVVLVFSCGVGVQTVADFCKDKKVLAACDTYELPGYQGVTPQLFDCDQCGMCFLNGTGGICPITACSKSLVNGQCGGAKNGKCEVDPDKDCAWEKIQNRLAKQGRLEELMKQP
ncbi:MAG: methylenetetrahydrofolate reductase C-terminal domain-containing protein, partial [Parasporobacterium sp.]|nr:methylenetetrahydrofolate reductase C-terminal domain-containing protein [Parasporobacterium sp.]